MGAGLSKLWRGRGVNNEAKIGEGGRCQSSLGAWILFLWDGKPTFEWGCKRKVQRGQLSRNEAIFC